ncbi:MAG: hypothetical protein J0M33_19890 [Anaerolineae bacterium]|nr:hypothetical protein [Anaerolineae bacterium]
MPMNRKLYPPDWETLALKIRLERGNVCQDCGVGNGLVIIRSHVDGSRYIVLDDDDGSYYYPEGTRIRLSEVPDEFDMAHVRVVLSVGHLDHNPANNAPENLRVMCQRCHNRYDAKKRAASRHKTRINNRRKERAEAGQLELELGS